MNLTEQPLNPAIQRMTLFFVGLFFVSCVAVAAYQFLWVAPEKRCESHDAWWDPATRVCATPVFLPALTHRPIGAPKVTPQKGPAAGAAASR